MVRVSRVVPVVSVSTLLFVQCTSMVQQKENKITVTILPLKYLAANIVGNDFDIITLVPPGSSPESYEPTPVQMVNLSKSQVLFTTGLVDFEVQLADRLKDTGTDIIALSSDIELLEGDRNEHHNHGVDPHIWTSPRLLKKMATAMYESVNKMFPDSVKYLDNYNKLCISIDRLDSELRTIIDSSNVKSFVIFHPALTYYADEYGIEQIALEHDGKEPSAIEIERIVKLMREQKINKILYQSEFSRATVETLARETSAQCVEIDPLSEDVENNLISITRIITSR